MMPRRIHVDRNHRVGEAFANRPPRASGPIPARPMAEEQAVRASCPPFPALARYLGIASALRSALGGSVTLAPQSRDDRVAGIGQDFGPVCAASHGPWPPGSGFAAAW